MVLYTECINQFANQYERGQIDLFLSNPVPNLYIQNTDYEKKCLIEEVVKLWTDKFRTLAKRVPHPKRNPVFLYV